MNIYKMDLEKDFCKMRERFEDIFENAFRSPKPMILFSDGVWRPSVDVYETDENMEVVVEIPGLRNQDINVVFENNVLRIYGVRQDISPQTKLKQHQMEIEFGPFERNIRITVPIDNHRIKASYRDGFLLVVVPKLQKSSTKIEIMEES